MVAAEASPLGRPLFWAVSLRPVVCSTQEPVLGVMIGVVPLHYCRFETGV